MGDLQELKADLLEQVKLLINARSSSLAKKWLKSYEVEELLGISTNTLMMWRNNGLIPYSQLGGVFFYDPDDIEKVLNKHKQGSIKK